MAPEPPSLAAWMYRPDAVAHFSTTTARSLVLARQAKAWRATKLRRSDGFADVIQDKARPGQQPVLDRDGFDRLGRDVTPQILEPVVAARLRREHVQHDVEVVGDDPRPRGLAVDRDGSHTLVVLEPVVDLVVDRLRLPRVVPVADHEEIGEDADGPHVEDDDVLRQLFLRSAGDAAGLFE